MSRLFVKNPFFTNLCVKTCILHGYLIECYRFRLPLLAGQTVKDGLVLPRMRSVSMSGIRSEPERR